MFAAWIFTCTSSFFSNFYRLLWLGILPWNFQHICLYASFKVSLRPFLSKYYKSTSFTSFAGYETTLGLTDLNEFSCYSSVLSNVRPWWKSRPSIPLSLNTFSAFPIPFPITISFKPPSSSPTSLILFSSFNWFSGYFTIALWLVSFVIPSF